MLVHTVAAGDCFSSIAEQYGFFWETLWGHPKNAELARRRQDPNTLVPGDAVFIPAKTEKVAQRPTGARHNFRLKGVPTMLRVRLLWGDEPRVNEPYVLTVDGQAHRGSTDGDGHLEAAIRPNARRASLVVGEGERRAEYTFNLGAMPPAREIRGALERLRSLGFYAGAGRDELDDDGRGALQAFQRARGLVASGELDDATIAALRSTHDGV